VSEHHRTPEWSRVTRTIKPQIAASLPRACIDCGRPIFPGDKWQVGHIVPVAIAKVQGWTTAQINAPSNLGPTHTKAPGQRACNQIAGGKLGASIRNTNRNTKKRLPSW
jgi:hypothetical protein